MTRRIAFILFGTIIVFIYAAALRAETAFEQECSKLAAKKGNDAERLHELFKIDWDHTMRENPEFATEVGYPGQNGRWTDQSLEAIERRKRDLAAAIKVIESIDRAKLKPEDQLNSDLFRKNKQDAIEAA